MMGLLRKIHWGVALVCVLFVVMNGSPAAAAEKPSEKEYLHTVYMNMQKVKSLHYDVAIKAETPMGEARIVMNGEGREKPLGIKHDINMVFRDMLNKEHTVLFQQYLEEDQGNLVMYLFHNNAWIKQVLSFDPSLNTKLSADDKAFSQNMWKLIKSVTLKREMPSFKYMEVTLDAVAISDLIGETVNRNTIQDKELLRAIAAGRLGLLAAGDLTYHVKVDKATGMITEVEIDLTGPIRKAAGLFLDIGDPKSRAEIEGFLARSTLTMQVTYSKYNQIDPIEIPQEVRDNAKEVKPAMHAFRTAPLPAAPKAN